MDDMLSGGDERVASTLCLVERSLRKEWARVAKARAGGRYRLSKGRVCF